MSTPTTTPYDWLKEIPTALLQMDDIPLLGYPPPFPWTEFTAKLAAVLQLQNLKITPIDTQWRSSDDLLSGLGGTPIPIHISIPGIDGELTFILADRDIHFLMSLLIAQKSEPLDIIDPDFQKGFLQFLTHEVIQIFTQTNTDKTLNPHLMESDQIPSETSLCQDISFEIEDHVFIIRLVISPMFRKAWKEKYAVRTLDLPLSPLLAQKITLPVHLEAGRVSMTPSEWKSVHPGDFVILELCSIDPTQSKGRVMMTVNGLPFFRGMLKQGNIKILEHPLYYEADSTMAKQYPEDEEYHEESEFDLSDDEHFLDDDELSEVEADEEEESLSDHHDSDEHDETSSLDEESEIEESPIARPKAAPSDAPSAKLAKEKAPLKPEEIPLSIVVEVGRLEMSIQKIMELQPGNVLELDVRPENGVDLVVNGRRIGKGELLRIGEALGVRVLDIG